MTETIGIIGLGLIGGSFALAAKRQNVTVLASDTSTETLQAAFNAGAIDKILSPTEIAAEASLIVISVPVASTTIILSTIAEHLKPNSVVMDVGSSKRQIVTAADKLPQAVRRRFVPAHPIAGIEESGFEAATDDLFNGRWAVLCPAGSDDDAKQRAHEAWRLVGAKTVEMETEEHDSIFGIVSHLPHLLSYALVEMVDEHGCEGLRYAAGGFLDFTRIAGSHPDMWLDIFLSNSDKVIEALEKYQKILYSLTQDIQKKDSTALWQKLSVARDLRQKWIQQHFSKDADVSETYEHITKEEH